jgi:hypothetical protein
MTPPCRTSRTGRVRYPRQTGMSGIVVASTISTMPHPGQQGHVDEPVADREHARVAVGQHQPDQGGGQHEPPGSGCRAASRGGGDEQGRPRRRRGCSGRTHRRSSRGSGAAPPRTPSSCPSSCGGSSSPGAVAAAGSTGSTTGPTSATSRGRRRGRGPRGGAPRGPYPLPPPARARSPTMLLSNIARVIGPTAAGIRARPRPATVGHVVRDVTGHLALDRGDADVEDGRAGLHHGAADDPGYAGRGDHDVGLPHVRGEVLGCRCGTGSPWRSQLRRVSSRPSGRPTVSPRRPRPPRAPAICTP